LAFWILGHHRASCLVLLLDATNTKKRSAMASGTPAVTGPSGFASITPRAPIENYIEAFIRCNLKGALFMCEVVVIALAGLETCGCCGTRMMSQLQEPCVRGPSQTGYIGNPPCSDLCSLDFVMRQMSEDKSAPTSSLRFHHCEAERGARKPKHVLTKSKIRC